MSPKRLEPNDTIRLAGSFLRKRSCWRTSVPRGIVGGYQERCETDQRGVLVQNERGRVHEPMVPLFSLSLSPRSIILSLSLSLPLTLLFTYPYSPSLSLQPASPSLSLFLSLSFSRSLLLAVLSLEREPLDGRTKAAGCFSPLLLFCLSVRLSSVAPLALFSSLSFSHSFPSSRAVAGSLVSSVHRPGLFVFFSLIIPLRAIVRVN